MGHAFAAIAGLTQSVKEPRVPIVDVVSHVATHAIVCFTLVHQFGDDLLESQPLCQLGKYAREEDIFEHK